VNFVPIETFSALDTSEVPRPGMTKVYQILLRIFALISIFLISSHLLFWLASPFCPDILYVSISLSYVLLSMPHRMNMIISPQQAPQIKDRISTRYPF